MTGGATIFNLDAYAQSPQQLHGLGSCGYDKWGDEYRYTRIISTGTDLIAGNLQVALAVEANHQNRVIGANVAIGVRAIEFSVGGTQVDANEYDEGNFAWNDVTPEGETYRVLSHDASAAGSEDITVNLERPLLTAATTTSQGELVRNPWNNPAISQLITERPAGVTISDWDVSVGNFGWLKVRGVAACLQDTSASTVGQFVTISNQVNGATGAVGTISTEAVIGQTLATSIAAEFNSTYFTIS